jgi:hypothetical protein
MLLKPKNLPKCQKFSQPGHTGQRQKRDRFDGDERLSESFCSRVSRPLPKTPAETQEKCPEVDRSCWCYLFYSLVTKMVFVERSSTKECTRQPPPSKFGNKCKKFQSVSITEGKMRAWCTFLQFYVKFYSVCMHNLTILPFYTFTILQFYNFQALLNHRAKACALVISKASWGNNRVPEQPKAGLHMPEVGLVRQTACRTTTCNTVRIDPNFGLEVSRDTKILFHVGE